MTDRRRTAVQVAADTRAPAAAVWACLADAGSFASWVSGTARIRGWDPGWPAVGTRLHHCWGPWPVRVRDSTTVTRCEGPSRLELRARVGAIATVRITIRLIASDCGTRIVLREDVEAGLAARVPGLTRWVQRWRNRRSVARLARLARTRRSPDTAG